MKSAFLILLLCSGLYSFSQSRDTSKVFQVVQQMPEFPGGDSAMTAFIRSHLHYPDSSRIHNIQGRVVVGYIINRDGSLSDIDIKKHIAPDLDSEAVRVVQQFPRFKPGMQSGKTVRVSLVVPITFKLQIEEPPKDLNSSEVMPMFPGGEQAILRFIQTNINYPAEDREKDIQGQVITGFVVNEDGSLSDFTIKKSVSPRIDAEALRVVKLLPKFKPAMKNGVPVKVDFTFPIMFTLLSDQTAVTQPKFPGGEKAMLAFIKANLKNPTAGKPDKFTGNVPVAFDIDEKGAISNIKLQKNVSPEIGNEAIRVVKSFPAFSPAKENSVKVKSTIIVQVEFI